jgi:hypothetical protein
MSVIRWRHSGRNILLPIAILRPNTPTDLTSVGINALVDTGATTSGIASTVVKELGLVSHTKKLLKSAHGEGHVAYFIFRIGLFPDTDGHEVESAFPTLPFIFPESEGFVCSAGNEYQAILGMDILSQCDFSIDRHGRCILVFG